MTKGRDVSNLHSPLDEALYKLTMAHLAKLEEYVPGPVRKAGGAKEHLIARYKADPLFSIWGLDSVEYAAATLSGGTITSIHRKLGDIYQDSVKTIFMSALGQTAEQVAYSAVIVSGSIEETRTADAYLQFDRLKSAARKRIVAWCNAELRKLTAKPRVKLVGVALDFRNCYEAVHRKRIQPNNSVARHLLVSGILPVMPIFREQNVRTVADRYRTLWIVKQGVACYDIIRLFTGYDYLDFLRRNQDAFRHPILKMLQCQSNWP
jgi:hypothetical protein